MNTGLDATTRRGVNSIYQELQMKSDSKEFETLIHRSAALRGKGDFKGAIALIEARQDQFEEDCRLNAYLECFYAAREAGMQDKATEYARKVAAIDPEVPTVKAFLK
jgi:hypothetical protein